MKITVLTLFFFLLLLLHDVSCSVDTAVQCLKDLETSIKYASQSESWRDSRDDFISKVNQVDEASELSVLFHQLRRLENSVKYSSQTKSWKQWKRSYWRVMTDHNLNSQNTVTKFIITLKFMEQNLLHDAHYDSWMESSRGAWLDKCNAKIDPLLKLSFYDELFLNVDYILQKYGYDSLQQYNRQASEVISNINSAARKLDEVAKDTGIADTTAGGLGIASGVLTGVGLALAPFTAGTSLALTGSGVALGVGSAATSITSNIIQTIWDERKFKEVKEETEKITAETMALAELLETYAEAANDLKTELDGLGDLRALAYLKKAGLGGYKVYSGIDRSLDAFRMTKIVGQIRPDLLAKGLGTRIALDVAAPGVRIPGWITRVYSDGMPKTLIKGANSLGSAAAKLSGFLSVLSVGFGIWETISGAKKIEEGSELAKEFRKLTKDLTAAKNSILEAYDINAENAFEDFFVANRQDSEGRSEEWRRACFHGDMCSDLALLSYSVNALEAEQICRRNGLWMLSVGSAHVSDIVRSWIRRYDRSAWFSNASPYKAWAPGYPDYEDYCVFFSSSRDFRVEDVSCNDNGSGKSAVLCA